MKFSDEADKIYFIGFLSLALAILAAYAATKNVFVCAVVLFGLCAIFFVVGAFAKVIVESLKQGPKETNQPVKTEKS